MLKAVVLVAVLLVTLFALHASTAPSSLSANDRSPVNATSKGLHRLAPRDSGRKRVWRARSRRYLASPEVDDNGAAAPQVSRFQLSEHAVRTAGPNDDRRVKIGFQMSVQGML